MDVSMFNAYLVSTSVAVVGGGENGDHVPVVRPVVPLHDQLVSSGHQGQSVAVVECLRDVLTEGVASTSWADTPTASVIRVRPKKVANRSKQIALAELLSEENPYPSWGVSWTLSSCLI